jgi:hypothetical protein
VALRPDVIDELHGRGSNWLSSQSVDTPVRKWPRRRRADGRRWWDLENDERIRRVIEDHDYLERAADRRRRKLDLLLPELSYDYWPRRMDRARSTGSLDRAPRRSRSQLRLLFDEEDRYGTRRSAALEDMGIDYPRRLEQRYDDTRPAEFFDRIIVRDSLRDPRLSRLEIRD